MGTDNMRDWRKIDQLYSELMLDVYPQPDEGGRIEITRSIVQQAPISECHTVLDLGCGEGYAAELLTGKFVVGVTALHDEAERGRQAGRSVHVDDFNFLSEPRFDMIFASHVLEHSPFPLITLMLWTELSNNLLLIAPNPEHYGYIGKNHYSVMPAPQLRWILRRAGWMVAWHMETKTDLAFFCKNFPRVGSEGWAPGLSEGIYKADRDNL